MPNPAVLEREERARAGRGPRRRRRGVPVLLFLIVVILVGLCGFFARDLSALYFPDKTAEPAVTELMGEAPDEVIPIDEGAVVSVWNVVEILQPASELVTTKYYYTDADVFEHYKQIKGLKIPLTTNKTVFTYDGVISVGVDFSKIGIEVDNEGQRILVKLPDVRVIANEIDAGSFRYYDVSSSVFNQTEMGDVTELIDQLKQKKEEKILADRNVLDQAEENARSVIESFLNVSELTKDYSVVFQ